MIEAEKKNKLALDIALHIPMPSIKIRIIGDEEEKVENTPLHYSETKEDSHDSQK